MAFKKILISCREKENSKCFGGLDQNLKDLEKLANQSKVNKIILRKAKHKVIQIRRNKYI